MADRSNDGGPPTGLREAYRLVAEVADELARSADAPPLKRRDLALASERITRALGVWPDDPRAWAEAAPFVADRSGCRTTIPDMLLIDPGRDPRRIARLLLRALDWKLPP